MQSSLYHLQMNIEFSGLSFYKELLDLLGWSIIFETDELCGYKSGENGDLWFVATEKTETSDFDNRGVNHIALRVEKESDIDEVVQFLQAKNVESLFETPRHRPEFAANENETYYQVMFKTADNLLFEIVYIGSKA